MENMKINQKENENKKENNKKLSLLLMILTIVEFLYLTSFSVLPLRPPLGAVY